MRLVSTPQRRPESIWDSCSRKLHSAGMNCSPRHFAQRARRRQALLWISSRPIVRRGRLEDGRARRSIAPREADDDDDGSSRRTRRLRGTPHRSRRCPRHTLHLTARGRRLRPVAAREVARLERQIEERVGDRRTAALRAAAGPSRRSLSRGCCAPTSSDARSRQPFVDGVIGRWVLRCRRRAC